MQCRLCDRCSLGYQRESTSEGCAKCPDVESNRSFLSLGGILIILAVGYNDADESISHQTPATSQSLIATQNYSQHYRCST